MFRESGKRNVTCHLQNSKYTPIEKETGVTLDTTKNGHQTNTQEDKDQGYMTPGSIGRTV
jgi:hypothetical protein